MIRFLRRYFRSRLPGCGLAPMGPGPLSVRLLAVYSGDKWRSAIDA